MSRRPLVILGFGVLLALSWAQAGLDVAAGKARVSRWQLEPVWTHQEADGDVWEVAFAEGGRRDKAAVVAKWDHILRVLNLDGTSRANGNVPWGTQMALGDLDADGRDEILLGTEMDESREPFVQAVNLAIEPFGPSVQFHDMRILCSLQALDLDGTPGLEVALGDFRGCVSTMRYPDFLWDHCPPDVKGEEPSGDPHAARPLAAMPDGRFSRLVVARPTGGVRVPLGEGKVLWSYQPEGDLADVVAGDLESDGRGEVVLLSDAGRVTALGTDGGEIWAEDLGEPASSLALLDWDGDGDSLEIAVGGDNGRVSIFDSRGRRVEDWQDMDGQVAALQVTDLDRNGRAELVAGMGSYQFALLRPDGPRLIVATDSNEGAPWKLAAREDLLVVGTGGTLRGYHLAEVSSGWWHSSPMASLLFTLVMIAVMRPLLRGVRG